MLLSVVRPGRTGWRFVWLKGTPNGSGLLPSPQPLYATAKILNGKLYQINNFEDRKNTKTTLEILFLYILKVKFQKVSFNSSWDIKWWNTKILDVNLFAFAYRLFHEDFSPIDGDIKW